jgi:ubiquinone/menaquinone biosynthesis C-methylase UbiE
MNQHTPQRYVLGHSPDELRRLVLQAAILRPITARLLHETGLGLGMRVLDLGCGVGDLTMLAAETVGPSGSVIGIDSSPQALALARGRVCASPYRNITFTQCAVEDYTDAAPFDAVIGRYVLLHQSDPARFLRAAMRLLRPGGILALHEIEFGRMRSPPNLEVWGEAVNVIKEFFRRALPHHDIANRLINLFAAVGLPCPKIFCEIPIASGAASPIYAWLAEGIRCLLPQLAQMGIATDALMPIDSLESRLRAVAIATHSQVDAPAQICAWAKL